MRGERRRARALVDMHAPLQAGDRHAAQPAHDQPPAMAFHGGAREARKLGISDRHATLEPIGEAAEARSEDDRDLGKGLGEPLAQHVCGARRARSSVTAGAPSANGPKAIGKSSPMVDDGDAAVAAHHVHRRRRRRELAQQLPTAAAGRAGLVAAADDDDLGDALRARGDHGGNGRSLGAETLGIGRVLDIGADMHGAVQRCAARSRP